MASFFHQLLLHTCMYVCMYARMNECMYNCTYIHIFPNLLSPNNVTCLYVFRAVVPFAVLRPPWHLHGLWCICGCAFCSAQVWVVTIGDTLWVYTALQLSVLNLDKLFSIKHVFFYACLPSEFQNMGPNNHG